MKLILPYIGQKIKSKARWNNVIELSALKPATNKIFPGIGMYFTDLVNGEHMWWPIKYYGDYLMQQEWKINK